MDSGSQRSYVTQSLVTGKAWPRSRKDRSFEFKYLWRFKYLFSIDLLNKDVIE